MLTTLKEQGVNRVFATPHFYPFTEKIETYLERRESTLKALNEYISENGAYGLIPEISLGAEILLNKNLSSYNFRPLIFDSLPLIMFEFEGGSYESWQAKEIDRIASSLCVNPVIAHVDRYRYLKKKDIDDLAAMEGVIFQINAESINDKDFEPILSHLLERGERIILGSDTHNMKDRAPAFSNLAHCDSRPLRKSLLSRSSCTRETLLEAVAYTESLIFGNKN